MHACMLLIMKNQEISCSIVWVVRNVQDTWPSNFLCLSCIWHTKFSCIYLSFVVGQLSYNWTVLGLIMYTCFAIHSHHSDLICILCVWISWKIFIPGGCLRPTDVPVLWCVKDNPTMEKCLFFKLRVLTFTCTKTHDVSCTCQISEISISAMHICNYKLAICVSNSIIVI